MMNSRIEDNQFDFYDRSLLTDFTIIGGVLAVNFVFDRARPYLGPLVGSLSNRINPHWIQVRENTVYISHGLRNIITYLRSRRDVNLVRWLGSNLPSAFFPTNQRIHVLTKTSDEDPKFDDDHRRRLTTSFRCLPDSLIGDLDLEDGNSAGGIILAFKKSSERNFDSDTETDTVDTDCTESAEGLWGTSNFTMNFSMADAKCSTPKNIYMTTPGQFGTNATFTIQNDESSLAQAATDAKVIALEAELNSMKAMLALILENQTKVGNSTAKTEISQTVSPAIPILNQAPCPPPPPPPLPPMPISGSSGGIIKLKVGSGLSHCDADTLNIQKAKQLPSLTDVLKGLPGVKLKQIPRSPGGTPLKSKRKTDPSDLGSVMAAALRKRYARIQSPASSEGENDNSFDKENQKQNDPDDSFNKSPAFYKPSIKLLKSPRISTCIPVRDQSSSGTVREGSLDRYSKDSRENDTLPLFGQHLLKRRRLSAPRAKLLGLTEQSLNEQASLGGQGIQAVSYLASDFATFHKL